MTGRDLAVLPGAVPAVLWERLQPRQLRRPTSLVQLPTAADSSGDRHVRAALAEELARVASAPVGQRNRQLWESTRNLYNLVATGALDHREVRLVHPGRPAQPTSPERTHASPTPPTARAAGERTQEGR